MYNINILNIQQLILLMFFIGSCGIFLNRKNVIILLMSIEILLLSVNLNAILGSVFLDDMAGQILSLLILTVAGAESAIGLAILVIFYRLRGGINISYIHLSKG